MAINVFTWRITTNRVHLYINHYYGYVALPEVVLSIFNTIDIKLNKVFKKKNYFNSIQIKI